MNWPFIRRRNPARELALIGAAKRHAEAEARRQSEHEFMLATARRMRREKNLPPDRRLAPRNERNLNDGQESKAW